MKGPALRVESEPMNFFGEFEADFLYRTRCRLRCFKLTLMRRLVELFIVLIGYHERFRNQFRPGNIEKLPLPGFFIAGAQKSGTTSLALWLSQLPDFNIGRIGVPYFWSRNDRLKLEIQFFNNPLVRMRGIEWYSTGFALGFINGEKTPEYLFRKSSLREMRRFCPGARIIIMLRNPADRAYSAYKQYTRNYPRSGNWDWLLPEGSFEDNLQAEEYTDFSIGFLARGKYADQLEYLFQVFPRSQVKVIIFERFAADPAAHLEDVVSFLGGRAVNDSVDLTPGNVGGYSSRITADTRLALQNFYRPQNERLFKLLGFRIEEWERE